MTNSIEIQARESHIWQVKRTEENVSDFDSLAIVRLIANLHYSAYLSPSQTTYIIQRTKRRKPYFYNTSLKFSLAHTQGTLIIAYTQKQELGIDVESLERTICIPTLLSLSKRFFHPHEADHLYTLAQHSKKTVATTFSPYSTKLIRTFLKLWTQKEAYAKTFDLPLFTTLKLSQTTMEANAFIFPLPTVSAQYLENSLLLTLVLAKPKSSKKLTTSSYNIRFFRF